MGIAVWGDFSFQDFNIWFRHSRLQFSEFYTSGVLIFQDFSIQDYGFGDCAFRTIIGIEENYVLFF
jgi:hypothetical protein